MNAEGGYLLTQRPPGKHLAGLWEFPGGKVEDDESESDALRRELREELGIEAEVMDLLAETEHAYPQFTVWLRLFEVRHETGTLTAREASGWGWYRPEEMKTLGMPEADEPLVSALLVRAAEGARHLP